MTYRFGVIVDKKDCAFKDFCVGHLLNCTQRYCSLPLKMNPFCRAKSMRMCPKLFDVFNLNDGRILLAYFCDGRKCTYFASKLFSTKHLKKFGDNILTPAKIKSLLEKLNVKKEEDKQRTILDEVLEMFLSAEEIEKVKELITAETTD